METRKPPHALLVQTAVPSLHSRHQLPLPLLIAHVQSATTETAAHAQLVIPMHQTASQQARLVPLPAHAMSATLAALHPHAQPVKQERTKSQLATMSHALLAPWVSRQQEERLQERRLEANAVRVPLDTSVTVSAAILDAPSVHLASSRLPALQLAQTAKSATGHNRVQLA